MVGINMTYILPLPTPLSSEWDDQVWALLYVIPTVVVWAKTMIREIKVVLSSSGVSVTDHPAARGGLRG